MEEEKKRSLKLWGRINGHNRYVFNIKVIK